MGQKMNPNGLRVGIIKDWNSKWYADSKHFADYLVEDHKIREYVKKKLYASGISKVEIERTAKFVKVNVYTAKPGLVIGKGGNLAESLKAELQKMIGKDVNLNIVEVKSPDLDAQLVAENIAGQLERRISFRRAMKQCMQKTLIMDLQKQTQHMEKLELKFGYIKEKFFQLRRKQWKEETDNAINAKKNKI